jgi:hypothetical protein
MSAARKRKAPPPPPSPVEDAKDDAAIGRMLRVAEGNIVALLQTVVHVSQACLPMARRLKERLEAESNQAEATMTVRDQMLVLTRWSNLVQKGVDAARDMTEIKRVLLGDAATRLEASSGEKSAEVDAADDAYADALAELRSPGAAWRRRIRTKKGSTR